MKVPKKLSPLFENPQTHNIIEGGRGGGKTRTVGDLITEVMAVAPLNVLCCRETQRSLKDSSFSVLRESIHRNGYGDSFDIAESRGEITRGKARAVFTGLKEHTVESIKSFEGFHWVWIEEAQSVSKRSLEVLIPTLRKDGWFKVDIGGRILEFPLRMFVYTMNPFSLDDAINIVLPESRGDVQRIKINYWDNKYFPETLEKERQEEKKVLLPDEYARIWEGVPFEDTERSIMTRRLVQEAMSREASRDGGVVVGADIARFGDDRTVFVKRQGMQVVDTKILSGKDTQEVARRLHDFADGGRVVIDDTGVGGGVTDKLQELGDNVTPINFGSKAVDKKRYPDVISEMWFNLADNINEIGLPNNQEVLNELSSRHYNYTKDERRQVESKKDYKKRTGRRSPDMADAVILCFYNREIKPISFTM